MPIEKRILMLPALSISILITPISWACSPQRPEVQRTIPVDGSLHPSNAAIQISGVLIDEEVKAWVNDEAVSITHWPDYDSTQSLDGMHSKVYQLDHEPQPNDRIRVDVLPCPDEAECGAQRYTLTFTATAPIERGESPGISLHYDVATYDSIQVNRPCDGQHIVDYAWYFDIQLDDSLQEEVDKGYWMIALEQAFDDLNADLSMIQPVETLFAEMEIYTASDHAQTCEISPTQCWRLRAMDLFGQVYELDAICEARHLVQGIPGEPDNLEDDSYNDFPSEPNWDEDVGVCDASESTPTATPCTDCGDIHGCSTTSAHGSFSWGLLLFFLARRRFSV